jgi:hypothetical protein
MYFNRCIPYRWRKVNADQIGKTEEMIEVLMISSPKRDDLVFPKVLDISSAPITFISMRTLILKIYNC